MGSVRISADGLLEDSGLPEPAFLNAQEMAVGSLPAEALLYLLPSRYCESDLLASEAFGLFGHLAPGWSRVQSICDFVNRARHIRISVREMDQDGSGDISGAAGCLPGHGSFGHSPLPGNEHTREVHHSLPRRHWSGRGRRPHGLRRQHRSLFGRRLAFFRSAQQCATDRASDDRTWPGRRRRRHQHYVRASPAPAIPCLDGRGYGCVFAVAAFQWTCRPGRIAFLYKLNRHPPISGRCPGTLNGREWPGSLGPVLQVAAPG